MTRTEQYLISIILGLLVVIGIFINLWHHAKHLSENKDYVITEKSDSIRQFKSKSGHVITEKSAAQVEPDQFQKYYPELAKLITKELDIRVKDLKAVISARFEADGIISGKLDTMHVDLKSSLKRFKIDSVDQNVNWGFAVNDDYLKGLAIVNKKTLDYQFHYDYSDSLTFAISSKKKWLFGSEKLYGTGRLSNPKARIIGQQSVLIDKYRDKRFYLGAGVSYDPFVNQFRPTLQVGYAFVKF